MQRKACGGLRWKIHLWPHVTAHESTDKPLTHQASVLVHSDWPRIKEDEVNLALQELLVRKEKESLSLSGLQLAFGFMRVPDNVSSNLRQLLWVTQARPLLCHELSLLSSEANPQKSRPSPTKQHRLLLFYVAIMSTLHLVDQVKHAGIHGKQT